MKQHAEAQELKCRVVCDGKPLDNVWIFKYLGSRFRADGDQQTDVKARIAAATSTAGKMRAIWAAKSTPTKLKMRIYKTGVCSRLTYGSEAWRLDSRTCAMLNGANSRMVARITNRTPHEEASAKTRSFDVVRWIRARRLQWVGHILRMDPNRLVYKAVKFMSANRSEGDLLMDLPIKLSWAELLELAKNRDGWRHRVHALRNNNGVSINMNDSLPGRLATRRSARHMQPSAQAPSKQAPASPSARKYLARDAHEAFFRPGEKGKRKRGSGQVRSKKRRKNTPWTDKQRASWAREHYRLNHGSEHAADKPPDTPTTPWTPQVMLGHHRNHSLTGALDTTTMPPVPWEDLLLYSPKTDRDNLQNLSDLSNLNHRL